MKTLLIHSPGDSPCDTPWMGVPALVGHLKNIGYTETYQRDLDMELFYYSMQPEASKRIFDLVREHRGSLSKQVPWFKRFVVRWFGIPLLKWLSRHELRDVEHLEKFRKATPVGETFPEEGLIRYRKALNGILKLMGTFYYPYLAYPKFFSRREERNFYKHHLRLGNYLYETMNLGEKAVRAFYEDVVIPDIKENDYDVVGISVLVQRQYDTGLLLAQTIRDHGLRCKVVMGGSYISNTYDSGWLEDEVVQMVDYVVRYEGEDALPALMECIKKGEDPSEVRNLVYFRDGERVENQRDFMRDINVLPPPDYDDLDLSKYLDRPVRLPIMGNRGCYWAKCTFCAHFWALGTGRMRLRSAERQLDDMKTLMAKYGTNTFFFADEAIEVNEAKRLSHMILEEDLDVNWSGMVRFEDAFDEEYLKLTQSAGFFAMLFGLETISQRVQDIIKKGTDIPVVWRILKDCKKLGIKVHMFIILGTPGETEEEMQENVDFLVNNTDLYDTLQIATFELSPDAPMHRRPQDFGITNLRTVSGHLRLAYSSVEFDTDYGLSRQEVKAWSRKVEDIDVLFDKDIWSGYGFRLYQPDPTKGGRFDLDPNGKPIHKPKQIAAPAEERSAEPAAGGGSGAAADKAE